MNGCGSTTTIQQGDQYGIPLEIRFGETVITPDNCSDLRVQIGDVLYSYSKGELTYNAEDEVWEFRLTEEMSRSFGPYTSYQVGVKIGDDFIYSRPITIDFAQSLIRKEWSE